MSENVVVEKIEFMWKFCVIYIRCSLCILLNHLHTVKGVLLINQKHLYKMYSEKHTKTENMKKMK